MYFRYPSPPFKLVYRKDVSLYVEINPDYNWELMLMDTLIFLGFMCVSLVSGVFQVFFKLYFMSTSRYNGTSEIFLRYFLDFSKCVASGAFH